MLHDLNLAWTPGAAPDRLAQTLSLCASLGYGTVALNHSLDLPLPAKPTAPPLPSLPSSPPPPPSPSSSSSPSPSPPLPRLLRRATLVLADPAALNYRLPALAAAYDVLAVRPLTEKAFNHACLALDVPLVSLDLTAHFPFHFRPRPCMAAVARGVRFELPYAQLLAADPRGRANFIANLSALVRATRGRGLVVSSEAASALALRAPADVVNLLAVWGLAPERALEGLRSVPRSILVNEAIKRNGFRGVVHVVHVASPRPPAARDADPAEEGHPAPAPAPAPPHSSGNQKRKPAGDEAAQPTSKRRAKKMRLAASEAVPGKPQ